MPPTQVVMRTFALANSHISSRLTCSASSRVGAITSANGVRVRASASADRIASAMAIPNATVLPEPVWADTSKSRPRASGVMTEACTGVGSA